MKNKVLIILLILIVGFFVGLYIYNNNILNEANKKYNVLLSNMHASVINSAFIPNDPVIESTFIKASDVLITKPGDYAIYTFDVENKGDTDVILKTINKINPKCISLNLPEIKNDADLVCNNLEYKLYYTKNNQEVKLNDILKMNTKENITIKIGYNGKQLESSEGVQVTLYDMNLLYERAK